MTNNNLSVFKIINKHSHNIYYNFFNHEFKLSPHAFLIPLLHF